MNENDKGQIESHNDQKNKNASRNRFSRAFFKASRNAVNTYLPIAKILGLPNDENRLAKFRICILKLEGHVHVYQI